jgi:hypothetical protein
MKKRKGFTHGFFGFLLNTLCSLLFLPFGKQRKSFQKTFFKKSILSKKPTNKEESGQSPSLQESSAKKTTRPFF